MKYRYLYIVLILVCSGYLLSAPTPGSAQDPLITESYLLLVMEQEATVRDLLAGRISILEQQYLGLSHINPQPTSPESTSAMALASLAERVSNLEYRLNNLDTPAATSPPTDVGELLSLQVISLLQGESVYASAGAEIILRAGEMQVIATETGGLADITAGVDLQNGDSVPRNHLLLVPRDDGRGVIALSDAVFLLRGSIHYR